MRLKLSLLDEIHDSGDTSQTKRAVSNDGNGSVQFQPRIRRQFHGVRQIDRRDQSKSLKDKYQWSSECPHERQAVGRPNHHINEHDGPSEEDEYLWSSECPHER